MKTAIRTLALMARELSQCVRHVIAGRIQIDAPELAEMVDSTESQAEYVESELDRKDNEK